jgi:uncharacterized protein (UPF0332 family)
MSSSRVSRGSWKLVEPSDDIAKSYMDRSASSLASAGILISAGKHDDAVPLIHFSMYHMLTALLRSTGIVCESHNLLIRFLKDLYGLDNRMIILAKKSRIDCQYYLQSADIRNIRSLLADAKLFNDMLYDFLQKSSTRDIYELRKKMQ